ncbi:bifunctional diguanylate cyclase/phosphodiesterase [uncultured Tateyamaria sp.]|uniref:putative bifunctional diguanylate cyclase/phosphodiesterase n=1 Tax=uncultured Tateyamaria sp. TaxID=455651 RepID=UPI0026100E37|nr:bifunctional diguanylate cyclase/phosphodiesterase [uncultured Tateyamaria sp.]
MNYALTSVTTFVRRAIGLDDISLETMPVDAANRLRKLQMRGAIEQMRVFVIGNTFFAPVLAFQAWGAGVNGMVLGWTAVMLAFSWWLFWAWLSSYRTDGHASDMTRFVTETKINASIWCLGFVLFFPFADGDSKTVLTSVMVGSLALGTIGFAHAPIAAFWYLAIQATTLISVPTLYSIAKGTSQDLLLGVLAVVASAAIFNATLERAKEQMRAFKNHEALAHKTEVVDLLLKDYEEHGNEWIWRTDAKGKLVSCPSQILELLSVDDGAVEGADLIHTIGNSIEPDHQSEVGKVQKAFDEKVDLHNVVLPLRSRSDGAVKWIVMKGRPQYEDAGYAGFRGIFADATATIEANRHVEFLAKHDPLTQVYNRNYVQAFLEDLDPERDHAIIFQIDLDGFKQVNDGYGHTVGDKLLQVMAERLKAAVDGASKVARLGGDEFLVICKLKADEMLIAQDQIGQRLLESMSKPFDIDHLEIGLSGSVGIAKFPQDTDQGSTLLSQVDLALYAAKRGGRNRCVAFVSNMMDGVQKRIIVTERLRKAVQAGSIESYYQPQHCAQSGRMIGAEALARWYDPELGFVAPDLFISIAEETGLIHELGEQLLRRACLDALKWAPQEDGTPLMLAVNLSPVEVMRSNVAQKIQRILDETKFPATRLEVEITEGVLIDDVPATKFLLEELSDAGITIALDDFGTGYSSLSYVRALPLNRLKIDRSFVFGIEEPEAQSIISTIVGLSERLNLEVVAEGVETQKGVEILGKLGCDVLQGYYFSRPLAAKDFEELTFGQKRLSGDKTA